MKIWDLGSSRELLTLKGPFSLRGAAFSPDGRTIYTGAYGSMGRLWEAATPEQVAVWEAEEASGAAQRTILQEAFEKEQDASREAHRSRAIPRRQAIEQAMKAKLARPGDPAPLAGDPGAIRQWLALASPHSWHDAETQLDDEQIPDEARLRPRAKELVNFVGPDGDQRVWAPLQLQDYRLDFRTAIVANSGATVAYAVSYILSERDQTGLVLKVGSDYNAKIYLNQREIYRRVNPDTVEPDRDAVTGVELKAGLNVLVLKVVRMEMFDELPWGGSVRFTTADGQPVKGITVTLDPDGKK